MYMFLEMIYIYIYDMIYVCVSWYSSRGVYQGMQRHNSGMFTDVSSIGFQEGSS